MSPSAFNLTDDVPPSRLADTAEGAAEWATAEPEEDEYMQYFDWDRFEAQQGDRRRRAADGAAGRAAPAAGREQGGEE